MDKSGEQTIKYGVTPVDVMASMSGLDFVRAIFARQLPSHSRGVAYRQEGLACDRLRPRGSADRSTHSRRIDPISRSAKPFCQGEAGTDRADGLTAQELGPQMRPP
jgi:hypothetical protein